jgi:UDP-N-acetylmuramoyl-L-alanyl-D-glutamate--2,6-diaminopimelate ligase
VRALSLSELARRIAATGDACEHVGADPPVTDIAIDSRRVAAGDLFAALPGSAMDGRDFIPQAIERGAAALLLPDDTPAARFALPLLRCAQPRRAAGLAAQALADDPSRSLSVLGVTGTNGKSSCVHLLQALLPNYDLLGTLRCEVGGLSQQASHTTPDPVTLAGHLAGSRDAGREGLAMEVSSHALDQDRVAGVEYAGVLYTNLSRDHLDYHGDMKQYLAAKARLLGLRRTGAPALINMDDPAFVDLISAAGTLTYGRAEGADYRLQDERHGPAGCRFRLRTPDGVIEVSSPLHGSFNAMNVAGVLALTLELGRDPAELLPRLAAFPGLPGRMEAVELAGGPAAIVDFAHSPDAVARVLDACRPLCKGRLVALLGAGGNRDRGKRPLMAAAAQARADLVILTSDNPRDEDPVAILDDMERGMDDSGASWHKEVDRAAAIRLALNHCGPDDFLALLGKGHETGQEIAGTILPFGDVDELRRAWAEGSERE